MYNMDYGQGTNNVISNTEQCEKYRLNKLMQSRARNLEEQCMKIKEYRRLLEQKKMFWKNREEQFRLQCYQIKKLAYNQDKSDYKQNMGSKFQQEQQTVDENTQKLLQKAEKFLKQQTKISDIHQRKH